MDRQRRAGRLGSASAALVVGLVALPYVLLDLTAVGPYYAAGPGGLAVITTLPLLAIVALAAALRGRQDPALMAGATVVLAAVTAGFAWWWALSVSPSLVGGLTDLASFDYHRWALAGAATVLLGATLGYARAVL